MSDEHDSDGRRHKRYPVRWAVDIEVGDWNDALTLTTGNISRGGLFVRSAERSIEPGAPIRVFLRLPDETRFEVEAEVVHVIPASDDGGRRRAAGFGVRFDDRHATDLMLLEAMAASHAAGTHRYSIDEYISLEAVLRGLDDGFTTRTSAHQLVHQGDDPVPRVGGGSSTAIVHEGDLEGDIAEAAGCGKTAEHLSSASQPPSQFGQGSPSGAEILDETAIVAESSGGVIGDTSVMGRAPEVASFTFEAGEQREPAVATRELSSDAATMEVRAAPGADASSGVRASSHTVEVPDLSRGEGLPPTSQTVELQHVSATPGPVTPAAPPMVVPEVPEVPEVPAIPDDADDFDVDVDDFESSAVSVDAETAIFGIDLGTSYSSIALVVGDQLLVLHDAEGQTLLPSAVCYPERGAPVVGWAAREKQLMHPTTTFVSPKRLLGRRHDDPAVGSIVGQSPLKLSSGPAGQIIADVYGDPISMPQVCAEILKRLADLAEEAVGVRARRVVLSAPVGYGVERQAIERAAVVAGLEVMGMLMEPYAAAISYGLGKRDQTVAVFDFGGGTLDITLLKIEGGQFHVLAEAGDPWLGGDDFDLAIAGWVADRFHQERRVELRSRAVEWQRLLFLCERAKRKLSFERKTRIEAKGIVLSIKGAIDLSVELTREQLEMLAQPLVERAIDTTRECFQSAGISRDDVDQVVMTGGVSRMPLVRQLVGNYFGRPIELSVDPEQAIVVGNALFGRFKSAAEGEGGA